MSSNKRGNEYNALVRLVVKMPRPVRILFFVVLIAAMLVLTMVAIKSVAGQPAGAPTATPTAEPTPADGQ